MSDQSGNRRHISKSPGEGGWFIPADAPADPPVSAAPRGGTEITDSTPQRSGGWYVPAGARALTEPAPEPTPVPATVEDAVEIALPLLAADESPISETIPAVEPSPEPAIVTAEVSTATPQAVGAIPGAALSSQIDYENYVPGQAFGAAAEPIADATSPSGGATTSEFDISGVSPRIEPISGESMVVQPVDQLPNSPRNPGGGTSGMPQATPTPGSIPTPSLRSAPAAAPLGNTAAAARVSPVGATGGGDPGLAQRFTDVEQQIQVLRRRYTAGSLTGDQLRAELRKLMIADDSGNWWMIGMESDRWYRYDGKDWIAATPPGRAPQAGTGPLTGTQTMTAVNTMSGSVTPVPVNPSIPLGDYGMPLPAKAPYQDPGFTVVGQNAPYLDNTLPNAATGSNPIYQGATRSTAGDVTQPTATAYSGGAAGAAQSAYAAADAPINTFTPDAYQPDYGPASTSVVAGRQRNAGCVIRAAIVALVLALVGSLGLIGLAVIGYMNIVNQFDQGIANLQTTAATSFQTTSILDGKGAVIAELNDPTKGGIRKRVSLAQIAPYLIHATVSTEDQRFYENSGFDVIGIARAMIQNLFARNVVSGASTITQELARTLVFDPNSVSSSQAGRKLTEIVVASEISRRYTKDQILEMYLNQIPYGNFSYGIEAAAETYFNKTAATLSLAESALLAGLPQAPAQYDPVQNREAAFTRMNDVLRLMQQTGCLPIANTLIPNQPASQLCINQALVNGSVVQIALVKTANYHLPSNSYIHPHFVNYIEQQLEQIVGAGTIYQSGYKVYTTLDPVIQTAAETSVKNQVTALASRHVTNGAALVVRPSDGAILAMVGSADFNNKDISGQVNIVFAPRQPGSSIKPFVYLTALTPAPDGSYLTPASILWDVKSCFGDQHNYCPVDYDGRIHGPRTIRETLANSYNIPAFKALQYDSLDRFKTIADQAGIKFPLTQPDAAGLATALGATEVRMIDLMHGYAMLANQGQRIDSFYGINKITTTVNGVEQTVWDSHDHPINKSQVADPGTVYLLTSILSDNAARVPAFGANSPLQLANRPAAVKTGTTNDFRDNWTIGYTASDMLVGVWVGNADNTPMINVEGVTGAGPIWHDIMTAAMNGKAIQSFPAPGNVARATICVDFGTLDFAGCKNRREEVFVNTQPPPSIASVLQTLSVDTFTGLIANGNCPDFTSTQTFLKVNDSDAVTWLNNDSTGQQWAISRGLTLPIVPMPTAQCEVNTPRPIVKITSPVASQAVSGLIQILGVVNNIPSFGYYRLELAQAANPAAVATLGDVVRTQSPVGVEGAFLGGWDTNSVPDGAYLLRVHAYDNQNHAVLFTIPVYVNNTNAPQPLLATPTSSALTAPNQGVPTLNGAGSVPTMRSLFPPTKIP